MNFTAVIADAFIYKALLALSRIWYHSMEWVYSTWYMY